MVAPAMFELNSTRRPMPLLSCTPKADPDEKRFVSVTGTGTTRISGTSTDRLPISRGCVAAACRGTASGSLPAPVRAFPRGSPSGKPHAVAAARCPQRGRAPATSENPVAHPDVDLVDPEPSAEANLLRREWDDRLAEPIASLTKLQRALLHLRAEGLRYREIADILGSNLSSVSSAVRRAVNKLGSMYE
jgi:Sigma-70, region 4